MDSCCEKKGNELAKLREAHKRVLIFVMVINFAMFRIEFGAGLISKSNAMKADSLDMLGDAIVFAFSLYVLHRSDYWKAVAAFIKGILIAGFGFGVLAETVSKAIAFTVIPHANTMGEIASLALLANLGCLIVLARFRNDDLNMRSTFTCARNDIISNSSVILAAILVSGTDSRWPDIVVGGAIAILFLASSLPILKDALVILKTKS